MSPDKPIDRARSLLAADKPARALAVAWEGVSVALQQGHREGVLELRDIATEIVERSSGRTRSEALQLATYCEVCLDGAGGGIRKTSIIPQLFHRESRRKCPDCAESIASAARVCRYCGLRFDPPQSSSP